ncbi:MAG: 1-aminocyclopropane-1-carboxylate deaminase [Flavobacteriales bacterium]|nr:MAG: 1-aminocyclopropane-1-carboxylate deaminase [Flavobacteriales bacterium]
MPKINENNIPLQKITANFLTQKKIELYVLREDLIHPEISGNKWRKLKYNLQEAKCKGFNQLLTFGGAYSNHIAATAAAGPDFGFKTIGIIRGDEISPLNATLQLAQGNGMIFKYISREQYRANNKYETTFIKELEKEYGQFYLVPEGGSNTLAVKGCTEIINNIKIDYDVICCACGTGGTLTGIIASVNNDKRVLGFSALKGGSFLEKDIRKLLFDYSVQYDCNIENMNWELITDYHLGGFAKIKPELIGFIREFKENHNVVLDFIYTGKMLFGLYDMIKNSSQFDNKTIIVVHTGGIQGNKGFEDRLNIAI